MNYRTPERRIALAASYVLGTQGAGARRRMRQLLVQDAALRLEVEHWESCLQPLTTLVPPVEPPRRLWSRINAQVATLPIPSRVKPESRMTELWRSLGVWRLATAALAVWVLMLQGPLKPAQPSLVSGRYLALLQDQQARTVLVVDGPQRDWIRVRVVAGTPAAPKGHDWQLWGLPSAGAPQALGLIRGESVLVHLSAADSQHPPPAFAVSLEPEGGSPTGAPTGPVLYSGKLMTL